MSAELIIGVLTGIILIMATQLIAFGLWIIRVDRRLFRVELKLRIEE